MAHLLPQDYSKFIFSRCQGLARPFGSKMYYPLLSMSVVKITPTYEYSDVVAYDDSETIDVDQILKKKSCEISITMDEKNDISWHAQHGSNDIRSFNSQAAGVAQPISIPEADIYFDAVQPGHYQIVDAAGLPVQNVSAVVLKWGKDNADADVVLQAGVHYNLNPLTGIFWLLQRPDTVAAGDETDLTGTYTKLVVDVSHRLIDIGGMSGDGLKCSLIFVGVNRGFKWRVDVPQVRLGADGDAELQTIDDPTKTPLKGKILKTPILDGTPIPDKYQFYRLQQLLQT
ncbi:MAG: hypothetical protein JWO56_2846 [Acidobacteria bacterium]|nr:hypothetical protein [Acidobacteriota bacterium]